MSVLTNLRSLYRRSLSTALRFLATVQTDALGRGESVIASVNPLSDVELLDRIHNSEWKTVVEFRYIKRK